MFDNLSMGQKNTKRYLIQMEEQSSAVRAVMHLNNIELVRKQHVKISFADEKEFPKSETNLTLEIDERESQVAVKDKKGIFSYLKHIENPRIEQKDSLNIQLLEKEPELTC